MMSRPSYLEALDSGALAHQTRAARDALGQCRLCPRSCRVDRLNNETGICKTGRRAVVASVHPHFGEEPELVGVHGSGTIFFTHCSLGCRFCQNADISHEGTGQAVEDDVLAAMMLELQSLGCHNINFVTPSHVVPQILAAVLIAAEKGLRIPLVYNSSGYDSVATLALMDGVIDIYMPDFKFWDAAIAAATCDAPDYPETARLAIREMHRQVGQLQTDARGIARRGMIIRHLVLPEDLAGTAAITRFIASELTADSYVNIMPQYRPCAEVATHPALNRRLKPSEFASAVTAARKAGLTRLSGF
ncbi:MAG: radical SAM protein [Pseudomonadota bacterium]